MEQEQIQVLEQTLQIRRSGISQDYLTSACQIVQAIHEALQKRPLPSAPELHETVQEILGTYATYRRYLERVIPEFLHIPHKDPQFPVIFETLYNRPGVSELEDIALHLHSLAVSNEHVDSLETYIESMRCSLQRIFTIVDGPTSPERAAGIHHFLKIPKVP